MSFAPHTPESVARRLADGLNNGSIVLDDALPPCRACKQTPAQAPGHFFCAACYHTLYPDWQTEYVLECKGLGRKKVWVGYRLAGGVWRRLGG